MGNVNKTGDAFKAINYKAVKWNSDGAQLGGDAVDGKKAKKAAKDDLNYKDGLTYKELEKLDKNKDGAVDKDEFKDNSKLESKEYQELWDGYYKAYEEAELDFSNDGSSKTAGFKATGKDIGDTVIEDGKLKSYSISAKDSNGKKTKVTREVKDGENKTTGVKDSKGNDYTTEKGKLQVGAGSTTKKPKLKADRDKDGDTTTIKSNKKSAAGESTVKVNKDNKLTEVKNDKVKDAKFDLSGMEYDDDGKLNKIKIDGKTYDGDSIIVKDNGNTVITKEDGSEVIIKQADKEGRTKIINKDKDGNKISSMRLNKNNEPEYVTEYDENGKAKAKYMANDSRVREYNRDDDGKLIDSTDYRTDENGEKTDTKLSEQKYEYNETLGRNVWSERTLYDEDGEVSGSRKYNYTEDGDQVKCEATYYDKDNNEIGKKVSHEGKDTPRIMDYSRMEDSDGNVTEVKYDSSGIRETKTVTDKDGNIKTYKWKASEDENAYDNEGEWELDKTISADKSLDDLDDDKKEFLTENNLVDGYKDLDDDKKAKFFDAVKRLEDKDKLKEGMTAKEILDAAEELSNGDNEGTFEV